MPDKNLEFYEDADVPNEAMQQFIEEEIEGNAQNKHELKARLAENTAASPLDSGGDVDADWEDVNQSGEESVGGQNPTPDQSDTEMNAEAMGVTYQDHEPLDFLEKLEKRDRDRFELDEDSKQEGDMI